MIDFYVYAHVRNDTKQIFYIGKGREERAWTKRRRSELWRNVVNKYGYHIEILCRDLREDKALLIETQFISQFGRLDNGTGILVNHTDGGDGTSGKIWDEESRARISAGMKKRWSDELNASCHERLIAARRTPESRVRMSESQKGNKNCVGREMSEETRARISESVKRTLRLRRLERNT